MTAASWAEGLWEMLMTGRTFERIVALGAMPVWQSDPPYYEWETLIGRSGNYTEHSHCEKCVACILDFRCGACGHVQVDPYGLQARNKKPAPYCLLHGGDFIEGDHSDCIVNQCRVCVNPVTNGEINDGDAHPIDERSADDGMYEHDWCTQASRQ